MMDTSMSLMKPIPASTKLDNHAIDMELALGNQSANQSATPSPSTMKALSENAELRAEVSRLQKCLLQSYKAQRRKSVTSGGGFTYKVNRHKRNLPSAKTPGNNATISGLKLALRQLAADKQLLQQKNSLTSEQLAALQNQLSDQNKVSQRNVLEMAARLNAAVTDKRELQQQVDRFRAILECASAREANALRKQKQASPSRNRMKERHQECMEAALESKTGQIAQLKRDVATLRQSLHSADASTAVVKKKLLEATRAACTAEDVANRKAAAAAAAVADAAANAAVAAAAREQKLSAARDIALGAQKKSALSLSAAHAKVKRVEQQRHQAAKAQAEAEARARASNDARATAEREQSTQANEIKRLENEEKRLQNALAAAQQRHALARSAEERQAQDLEESFAKKFDKAKQQLLQSTMHSMLRLCIVAPSVSLHINNDERTCKGPFPEAEIRQVIESSILPQFTTLYMQIEEGVAPDGRGKLDAWLEQMLSAMYASMRQHLQDIFKEEETIKKADFVW